uniref:Uncharacterized protein n=1 Tax=Avena sativa TaxID=4498 RepID=A0ACD5TZ93_AVESA
MEERIHRRQEPRATADPALSSGDESTDDGEFEFPCFAGGDHGFPALADDLFADGRIRPATFYPVFGRRPSGASSVDVDGLAPAPAPATERRKRGQLGRLFLEESRAWNSSSSSTGSTTSTSSTGTTDDYDGGGIEGAAPESYCVWAPGATVAPSSPRPPRPSKSGSTGSMARWRRISDLVVGRSHSDGKEKFLFLPANPPVPINKNPRPKPNTSSGGAKKKTEIGTVAAAQRAAQYGAAKAAGAGAPRRTFLPYREELVGFFANVHGISRSHPHPY